MYKDLKGKKLLILGGVKMACDWVRRAQKMGVCVYVLDYLVDSPAKEVADQGVLLNATDVDEIVDFCLKEKIDGITTGYVDILMPVCYEVCKRLNLPYYATEDMIRVSTDKVSFKEMCNQYNVPVPKTYCITKDNYIGMSEAIEYPIFVKPLDSSGSRGAAVCHNSEEFIKQFEVALSFSKKKEVIVEEYLKGTDFILDYILVDGEAYLLSMFDRKVCSDRPSAINHANLLVAPSHNLHGYLQNIHPNVVKMFKGMGFENGLIFLQGYIDGEKITIFEMGCRLGGTFPNIDEHFIDINPMDMLIHHALTGEMIDSKACEKFNADFAGKGGVVNLLAKNNGTAVKAIYGLDEICAMPEVVNCIRYMEVGDSFEGNKFTDKPVAIIYLVASNLDEFKCAVKKIYDTVKVYDENDESLLLPVYDVDLLDFDLYK